MVRAIMSDKATRIRMWEAFWRGVACLFDLSGSLANTRPVHTSDEDAVAADWQAVCDDFNRVLGCED